VLRRVARGYDGWLPYLPSASSYQRAWHRIRDLLEESGRPADSVSAGFYATVMVNHDERSAKAEMEDYIKQYYRRSLEEISLIQAICYGSPEKCIDWISEYLRSGARHVVIRIGSLTPRRYLDEIAEGLCAAVR
jgi:alkanesulfonate monooxygenase SsuD/methylene tetrahydromethanopterin reductase-like flavin-dependent oxidoreductase (luciferase family)